MDKKQEIIDRLTEELMSVNSLSVVKKTYLYWFRLYGEYSKRVNAGYDVVIVPLDKPYVDVKNYTNDVYAVTINGKNFYGIYNYEVCYTPGLRALFNKKVKGADKDLIWTNKIDNLKSYLNHVLDKISNSIDTDDESSFYTSKEIMDKFKGPQIQKYEKRLISDWKMMRAKILNERKESFQKNIVDLQNKITAYSQKIEDTDALIEKYNKLADLNDIQIDDLNNLMDSLK